MAKNIIFCFDGTCNDPEDAAQKEGLIGGVKDNSITNVLKLHLIFGGDLKEPGNADATQVSLYYSGVGTYGGKFRRAFNAALALDMLDVGRIIKAGLQDFEKFYVPGDKIFIFGFSRGAAIARRFAMLLNRDHNSPPINFLGVFETVASIGWPDLSKKERPASDVVFEHGHTIASNINEALHLVAMDEKRKAFQPILMNYEEGKVSECWFPGAHADVGGGYNRDGLSDGTLRFMLDELERRELGLEIIPPSQINYQKLLPEDVDYEVDFSDLIIEPDIFGKNHQQSRPPLRAWLTLDDRELRVNENDKKSDKLAIVHHSVAERIYSDRDYRPKTLQGQKHKVLYPDDNRKEFTGLQHHQEIGMRPKQVLAENESQEVIVYAHKKFNRTGLMLQKDVEYTFEVKGKQKWKDNGIECGPAGWNRNSVSKGLMEVAFAAMEPFRRCPEADWFALIGCVGDSEDNPFLIGGDKTRHKPKKSDELCAFANDHSRFYGNNHGYIRLTVTRLPKD